MYDLIVWQGYTVAEMAELIERYRTALEHIAGCAPVVVAMPESASTAVAMRFIDIARAALKDD